MALRKYTFNFDESLVAEVDEYASAMHLKRTQAFALLVSQSLEARKNMALLGQALEIAKQASNVPPVNGDPVPFGDGTGSV